MYSLTAPLPLDPHLTIIELEMNEDRYLKIMRGAAWVDLVIGFFFSFPALAKSSIAWLAQLHGSLSLGGSFPASDGTFLVFVSAMGFLLMFWALFRLRYSDPVHGLWDSFLRAFILFSTLGIVLNNDLSRLFLAILGLQAVLLLVVYVNYIRMRLFQIKDHDDHDH